jgi:DNA-binding transcriptional ArsR family regulator
LLTIRFGPSDLASVRLSVSPLVELWQSLRVLRSPVAPALHAQWLAEARVRSRELDLDVARLLELEPAVARDVAVDELTGHLRIYWQQVLAPHWDRIRTALEGDVLCRAQQSASGGIQALLSDLDGSVRYANSRLTVERARSGCVELDGRGLLLVPSVFVWPAVAIIDRAPGPLTLVYPARGSGLVWEPLGPPSESLAALIGPRRACILATLESPCSTTDLARRLEVGPGSVSQHLTVLREAGLIERHRVGRIVFYRRTAAGNLLVTTGGHPGDRSTQLGSGRRAA